ncbi:MAG: redoxin domain-containing protein [Isosphaeraceae bacterium]
MRDRSVNLHGRGRRRTVFGGLALTLAVAVQSLPAGLADSKSGMPVDRGLMQRIADFKLKDVSTDRSLSLYSFAGKRAIVLVFLGTDCPVGNLYVPRLIELNHAYKEKGVIFLGINSNAHEGSDQVARFVKETGIDFPVLRRPAGISFPAVSSLLA